MKRRKIILLILLIIIIFIMFLLRKDYIFKPNLNNKEEINNNQSNEEKDEVNLNIKVIINNKTYTATLEDNKTSKEFINMLPLEINMQELNNNEKYYYLDNKLATNSYNPKTINKGDIMLYGNNCLVLFYDSFNTSYSYTRLGKIDNPEDLNSILGSGNVIVRFEY